MTREEEAGLVAALREAVAARVAEFAGTQDRSGNGRSLVARVASGAGHYLGRRCGAGWGIGGILGFPAGEDYVVQLELWPPSPAGGAPREDPIQALFYLPMSWADWGPAQRDWRSVMGFFDRAVEAEVRMAPEREMEELVT